MSPLWTFRDRVLVIRQIWRRDPGGGDVVQRQGFDEVIQIFVETECIAFEPPPSQSVMKLSASMSESLTPHLPLANLYDGRKESASD